MEELLQYFETELDYMRRAFEDFETAHPQKAKALGIRAGRSVDPDVQRLSDSVALHAARLSKRLDDTLPETALDLMRLVAPGFLLGAPSYAIVRPVADAALADQVQISKGIVAPVKLDGERLCCQFTVAQNVSLWPVDLQVTGLFRAPFSFRVPEAFRSAEAVLTLEIAPNDAGTSLNALGVNALELYVSASGGRKRRLVEVLSGHVIGASYSAADAHDSYMLSAEALRPSIAKYRDTYLLDPQPSAPALSQLRDLLAYPDKAAFFTLDDTDDGFRSVPEGPVQVRLFLSSKGAQLLSDVEAGDICTNTVPLINIYRDKSEPLRYSFARDIMPLTPRSAAEMDVTCLRLDDVFELTADGEKSLPNITQPTRRKATQSAVWQERQEVGAFNAARAELSLSVPRAQGNAEAIDIVGSLLCSNGNAAVEPRPGDRLHLEDERLAECAFEFLSEPTAVVPRDLSVSRVWDLLSLLNGNFADIFSAENPKDALREALHLADPTGYSDASNAIWDVRLVQSVAPVTVGRKVILSAGSKIEVTVDVEALPFAPHVFATALQHFFAAQVSYDRFFQLSLRERGHPEPFKTFPIQHGAQICG